MSKRSYYVDLVCFISAPSETGYNRLMRTLELITIAMAAQGIPDYDVQLRSAKRAMAGAAARSVSAPPGSPCWISKR